MSRRTRHKQRFCLPGAFVCVDKPSHVTSHDVVDFVRLLTGDPRVGHCGTLDPRACGVLPLCLGSATRLADELVATDKVYRTVARLGVVTDTDDLDGTIVEQSSGPAPTRGAVEAALAHFRGEVDQRVPAYSAVRVDGKRLHDRARSGESVELPVRRVQIHSLEILDYQWPHLELEMSCSKGTYVRSLVRDLGARLGCGGAVDELVRTRCGSLTLPMAWTPAQLAGAWIRRDLAAARVPWSVALPQVQVIATPEPGIWKALCHGQAVPLEAVLPVLEEGDSRRPSRLLVVDSTQEPLLWSVTEEKAGAWWAVPRKRLFEI